MERSKSWKDRGDDQIACLRLVHLRRVRKLERELIMTRKGFWVGGEKPCGGAVSRTRSTRK